MTSYRSGAEVLAAAMAFAVAAHGGQFDKVGAPYLGHPLRVAARVVGHGDEAVAAALLHDVLEDSSCTPDDLRAGGIPGSVVTAVIALTRGAEEDHLAAVQRAAADPIARIVKRADIEDNLDPSRTARLADADRDRLRRKYDAALAILDGSVGSVDRPT